MDDRNYTGDIIINKYLGQMFYQQGYSQDIINKFHNRVFEVAQKVNKKTTVYRGNPGLFPVQREHMEEIGKNKFRINRVVSTAKKLDVACDFGASMSKKTKKINIMVINITKDSKIVDIATHCRNYPNQQPETWKDFGEDMKYSCEGYQEVLIPINSVWTYVDTYKSKVKINNITYTYNIVVWNVSNISFV